MEPFDGSTELAEVRLRINCAESRIETKCHSIKPLALLTSGQGVAIIKDLPWLKVPGT